MKKLVFATALAIGTAMAIIPAMAEKLNARDTVSVDRTANVFSGAWGNERRCTLRADTRLNAKVVSGYVAAGTDRMEVEIIDNGIICSIRGGNPVRESYVRGWVYKGQLRLVARAPGPPKLTNLPLAENAVQDRAKVNQHYTDIWEERSIYSEKQCRVNTGMTVEILEDWGFGWIEVKVLYGMHSGCTGWVLKRKIDFNPLQSVTGTGKWGQVLPVFKDRNAFFNARKALNTTGTYPEANIVCKARPGVQLVFKPYRDWGVGEAKFSNCTGWTDRGLIN